MLYLYLNTKSTNMKYTQMIINLKAIHEDVPPIFWGWVSSGGECHVTVRLDAKNHPFSIYVNVFKLLYKNQKFRF